MAAPPEERNQQWRKQVVLGDLSQDFLRPSSGDPQQRQINADHMTAQMLQIQQAGGTVIPGGEVSRLSVTLVQARLTKNYGITKMDPYCRIRVGHAVFETPTAHNGAKTPKWNKTVQCYLSPGVDSIYLEVFDERAFAMDDRIAWAHITIPEKVFNGETLDDWFPLSGRQGDEKEGAINVVLSIGSVPAPMTQPPFMYTTPIQQPVVMVPGVAPVYYPAQGGGVPVTVVQSPAMPTNTQQPQVQSQPLTQPQQPLFTEEDVKQVKDMFPNVEEEVIKSILEANRGNKDTTINNLLSMNS